MVTLVWGGEGSREGVTLLLAEKGIQPKPDLPSYMSRSHGHPHTTVICFGVTLCLSGARGSRGSTPLCHRGTGAEGRGLHCDLPPAVGLTD